MACLVAELKRVGADKLRLSLHRSLNKKKIKKKVNGKYIFNVHWPNSSGLVEGFCTVCEQPWKDLDLFRKVSVEQKILG